MPRGGPEGEELKELLTKEGIKQEIIAIEKPTRENLVVFDRSAKNQYRFGMPGSPRNGREIQKCLEIIQNLPGEVEYLVASGSLPPGVPDDLYGKIAEIAKSKDIKCVIDTSGKDELYPAWQGMQYMRNMLAGKAHIKELDNEGYWDIKWTSVMEVIAAH
jgi:6-phosphofructokinase 2